MTVSERVYDFDPSFSVDEKFLEEISAQQISTLSMKHCCLTDEHVDCVARLFKFPCLTKLDISFNAFSGAAIDRMLDALELSAHRLCDLEIAGMGSKQQRARLRQLLLRNRKFNALCDTHKNSQEEISEDFCCVACTHAAALRAFKEEISDLRARVAEEERKSAGLASERDRLQGDKEEGDRKFIEQVCALRNEVSRLSVALDKAARDKEVCESEISRLAEALEAARQREIAAVADAKGERQQQRETRKIFEKEKYDLLGKIHKLEEAAETAQEQLGAQRRQQQDLELELKKQISDQAAKAAECSAQLAAVSAGRMREADVHAKQLRAVISENELLAEDSERMRRSLAKIQADMQIHDGRAKHQESEIAKLTQLITEKEERIRRLQEENDTLKGECQEERATWTQRVRDLDGELKDERCRRESASREILRVMRGSLERVSELLEN